MAQISIGSLTLGLRPAIACIIDRVEEETTLKNLHKRGADLLEVRVDTLELTPVEVVDYLQRIRDQARLPVIGTIRMRQGYDHERLPLFQAIMPFVECVDIEIESIIRGNIIELSHVMQKKVIVSEHFNSFTPLEHEIEDMIGRAQGYGADIVKVAAFAHSRFDVLRLLDVIKESSVPLIGIAMGTSGTIGRVIAPLFGSLLTYSFLHDAVAPGQMDLDTMTKLFSTLYPEDRKEISEKVERKESVAQ